ncbi:MAG: hypothetical protein N2439_00475, partial [Anaerolineae bacterium]|nr:hypothetical protein [Anaerolineae bacterium]
MMRCACGNENPVAADRCGQCGRSLATRRDAWRWALDAAAAASLAIALGAVWALDAPRSAPQSGLLSPQALGPPDRDRSSVAFRPLRLAVTPPQFDDMGKLLASLGSGYEFTQIALDDLLDAGRLAAYDVVFATCGGVPNAWLGPRIGSAQRGGADSFPARPLVAERRRQALRSFVGRGRTLYASDWQFQLLEIAFPEMIDHAKRAKGARQTVAAEVVDRGLARRLGRSIALRFDQPAWYPAAFKEPKAIPYLRGTFKTMDGQEMTGPLLVRFPFEKGNVIFTSFHNEQQPSDIEQELLRDLVFATVTAREEADVRRTMIRGGFWPKERNLLSASAGSQPVVQEYTCLLY